MEIMEKTSKEFVLFKLLQAVDLSLPTIEYEDHIKIRGSISDVVYFDYLPKEYRNRDSVRYATHPRKLVASGKSFKPEEYPIQVETCKMSTYHIKIDGKIIDCRVAIAYHTDAYKQSCPKVLLYDF